MLTKDMVNQAIPAGVFVAPLLNERLGNNVLQVYRGFWFAAVHGIPLDRVVVHNVCDLRNYPGFFSRIRDNLIEPDAFDKMPLAVIHCCPDSMTSIPDGRRALVDLRIPERGGVGLSGAGFIYPELPWERSLFVHLFDNPDLRNSIAAEYAKQLCGNTIGYIIRRGDFHRLPDRRRLSTASIVADLSSIVEKHYGMVRIIVTSDDPDFVDALLRDNAFLRKYVFLFRGDPVTQIYLHSLCDYVISHRQYHCTSCWVNDPGLIWESTFGQVAQILNRSYKYRDHPIIPSDAKGSQTAVSELTRRGCDCDYPYNPRYNQAW